jgi:hypothetical protein
LVAEALRPYPQYFGVEEFFPYYGSSLYNSLQLTVTKRLTTGLGFIAAYTWSKTLTNADTNGPASTYGYSASPQDFFNRGLERSVATFNYPQNFKLTWTYETPFGKGRRWDLHKLNYVLGGWQLAAIHNYLSGAPIALFSSGLTIPDGFAGGIRPNVLSSEYTVTGAPSHVDYNTGTQYINPAAFANVPTTSNGVPLSVGTASRVIDGLRGPKQLSEIFRMSKKFYFMEKRYVGIGMTMTNPFNRHGPYIADTTVGDAQFGQLLEGGGGRTIQLDARIEF